MMLSLLLLDVAAVLANSAAYEYCSVHFVIIVWHFVHYCSAVVVRSHDAPPTYEVVACAPTPAPP